MVIRFAARQNRQMASTSAGILLFRDSSAGTPTSVQVLLGHMGGPFWQRKDAGAWSIPKGEYGPDEQPEAAARREFSEELGVAVPPGPLIELGSARQSGGKTVTVWALKADLDPAVIVPGTFRVQWPPGSGRWAEFPEVDRVEWFDLATASEKIVTGQRPFLQRLPVDHL